MVVGAEGMIDTENLKEALQLYKEHLQVTTKIRSAEQRGNMAMDHALKGQRKAMNLMTRQFQGGGVLGTAMQMLQNMGGMGYQNYTEKNALREKVKGGDATTDEMKQFSLLSQSKTMGMFSKLDKIFEKSFGGDSKWNKMFMGKGKMAAAGIGLGAAGAGVGLGAKIIDSSPLMQQMLKLLNFGIMLILRPIGDFFGMLMRPILILLLRKFIIPFYQTVYPWFLNAANQLNNSTKAIEDIGDGIITSIETSGKYIVGKLEPVMTPDPKTGVDKVTGFKVNSIDEMIKKLPKIITPTAAAQKSDGFIKDYAKKVNLSSSPVVMKPAFVKELEKISKIDNPKNLPALAKNVPPPKAVGGQAMVKVPSPAPVIKASSKAINVALKSIKAVDAVMSLPAQLAIKIGKGGLKLADKAIAAVNAISLNVPSAVGGVVKSAADPMIKPVTGAATKAAQKIAATTAAKMATRAVPIVGQVLLAIDGLGTLIQAVAPKEYTEFNKGVRGAAGSVGIPDWLTEGALDFVGFGEQSTGQQLVGLAETLASPVTGRSNNNGRRGMAIGGMINEEVRGFGKSGQRYVFGEGGSEMVTPMSKMGRSSGGSDSSGVIINVTVNGSIYSDRDMLKFQRTIMKAIETSSTRKAKL